MRENCMNKSEKKAIIPSKTELKVNPPTKVLPFDDGSKRKIVKKEP